MAAPLEPVRRTHVLRATPPRAVYDVVVDFEAYPRLFKELTAARVLQKREDGTKTVARVEFRAQVMLPVRYVLDLVCDPQALTVDWSYVEGEVIKNSQGGWQFVGEGTDTQVTYRVALDIDAPVPQFVLRKVIDALVGASLPAMWSSLEREVSLRKR